MSDRDCLREIDCGVYLVEVGQSSRLRLLMLVLVQTQLRKTGFAWNSSLIHVCHPEPEMQVTWKFAACTCRIAIDGYVAYVHKLTPAAP